MNIFKTVAKHIGGALLDFAYNEDRAIASLAGAPKDYTISGESAKHVVLKPLAKTLDAVHFGGDPHHAEDALKHDNELQHADIHITQRDKIVDGTQTVTTTATTTTTQVGS